MTMSESQQIPKDTAETEKDDVEEATEGEGEPIPNEAVQVHEDTSIPEQDETTTTCTIIDPEKPTLVNAGDETAEPDTATSPQQVEDEPSQDQSPERQHDSWQVEWLNPDKAKITFSVADASVCLAGRGSIRLVDGNVSGHGFVLQLNRWYLFECPKWSNWLVLESLSSSSSPQACVEVCSRLPGTTTRTKDNHVDDEHDMPDAISHGPALPPHLEKDSCGVKGDLTCSASFSIHDVHDPLSRPTVVLPAWRTAVEGILEKKKEDSNQKNSIIAVAGAKGVGKSTFVRYLIHQFLSSQKHDIYVLDGDTGQAEFGPPGLLTLTRLTQAQPLWSLPHHHMLTGRSSSSTNPLVPKQATQTAIFYGATTSQIDPGRYLQAMRQLMDTYTAAVKDMHHDQQPPLVVNLDGWTKGLGYQVLSTFLTAHVPSNVVQIVGNNATQQIDVSTVVKDATTCLHTIPSYRSESQHSNVSPALSVPSSAWRDLRLIYYWLNDPTIEVEFTQNDLIRDDDGMIAHELSAQYPYMVPWEAVGCRTVDGTQISPSMLNGCVVGLCLGDDPQNLPECVGLGLIRSVDVFQQLFYVLTPVAPGVLKDVRFFVHGRISLPLKCLFLGVKGCCFPFLEEKLKSNPDVLGKDPMRSRNNILRRGGNT